MGWQDAPLAKTPAGKNAWKSAPLATTAKGSLRTPGVAAAYRELEQRYPKGPALPSWVPDLSGIGERVAESATLGGYGLGVRNLAKGRVALQRALPGGQKMPYTADEYYEAARLFDATRREQYAEEHPVSAFVGDLGGAAVMPGGEAVGAFVTGSKAARLAAAGLKVPKTTQAAQLLRLSGVGGAFGAAQGAAQSRRNEALSEAKKQGQTGAVLAPTVGLAIPAGAKVVKGVADITSRIVKPRTAMQIASEKLGNLLQRAQVAPAAIRDALDHYTSTGLIEPSVYDVLRKAGAGPDVLQFFQVSGSYPNTRAAAAAHAAETTKALQPKAITAARELPTSGETRAPSQIREEQAAEAARVKRETEQAAETAARDAELATAGVRGAPVGPARGSGAKQLYTELNKAYDASKEAYEVPFNAAQAAHPESAVIPDTERSPVISSIIENLGHLNVQVPEVKKIALMIEDLRLGRVPDAPTTLPPLPENEMVWLKKNIKDPVRRAEMEAQMRKSQGLDTPVSPAGSFDEVRPLTVQQMWDTREALGNIADNTKSANVLRIVARGKEAIDAKLDQLLADNKIAGDPAVVSAWREGLTNYFQHQSKFGTGLAAELTARVPGKPTQTVVKPFQAGDVIFGKGENTRNLNDLRADLTPILDIVPDAIPAVQRELYTRVTPEKLPKAQERFNEVFGDLLPQDLTTAAQAAQQQAAQVEARNAQLLANTEKQNAQRLADAEAQQSRTLGAVKLGEGLRTMPSEEFTRAVTNVPQDLKPLVQAGGRQQLVNMLEKPEPGSTNLFGQLQSAQSTQNLGALYGDEGTKFQQKLEGLGAQARNTQELAQSVGGETPSDIAMIEQPVDLIRPKWLAARATLAKLRGKTRLSPEESLELYNLMKSQGAPDLDTLEGLARIKTIGPKPRVAVPVARALNNRSKEKTLDDMSNEYDLGY